MDPSQLLALIQARNYFAIVVIIIGYTTRLTNKESTFWLTVPARYQPLLVLGLASVYGVVQAVAKDPSSWSSWREALINAALVAVTTMGLFDVIVKAIWNGNPPKWIEALAFIFKKPDPDPPSDVTAVKPPTSKS